MHWQLDVTFKEDQNIDEASKACRNLFAIFCGCRFGDEQNGTLNNILFHPIRHGLIGGAILSANGVLPL